MAVISKTCRHITPRHICTHMQTNTHSFSVAVQAMDLFLRSWPWSWLAAVRAELGKRYKDHSEQTFLLWDIRVSSDIPYKMWTVHFPQEKIDYFKCKKWIQLCGWPTTGGSAFTVETVNRFPFTCTKHLTGSKSYTRISRPHISLDTKCGSERVWMEKKNAKFTWIMRIQMILLQQKGRMMNSIPSWFSKTNWQVEKTFITFYLL